MPLKRRNQNLFMKNKKISKQIIEDLKSGTNNWRINERKSYISLEHIGGEIWYSLVKELDGNFKLFYPSSFEFENREKKKINSLFEKLYFELLDKEKRKEEKESNKWLKKAFPGCFK